MYDLLLTFPREELSDQSFAYHILIQLEKYVQRIHTTLPAALMALFAQIIPYSVLEKFKDYIDEKYDNESENRYHLSHFRQNIIASLLRLHDIVQQIKSI